MEKCQPVGRECDFPLFSKHRQVNVRHQQSELSATAATYFKILQRDIPALYRQDNVPV